MQAAHRQRALLQSPDQIERLVGGDAATDDQQHAPCGGCGNVGCHGRRLRRAVVAGGAAWGLRGGDVGNGLAGGGVQNSARLILHGRSEDKGRAPT